MSDPKEAARIGAEAAKSAAPAPGAPAGKAPGKAPQPAPAPAAEKGPKESTAPNQRKTVRVTEEDLGVAPAPAELSAAAIGAEASSAETSRPASTIGAVRRTRKARLRLSRIDPWSVMKTVFLFSIAGGIALVVAIWIVWGLVNATGVFESINRTVNDLVASPGAENPFDLKTYVNGGRVVGLTAVISGINVVLLTALATLGSFLYNLAATVMGGLEVTLAED